MKKIKIFPFAIITCLYVTSSFATPVKSRLIGGKKHDLQKESVVLIMDKGGGACSGVLIASQKVLTAAHCYSSEYKPSTYKVVAGDETYSASNFVINSLFNINDPVQKSVLYDLGVITLKKKVKGVKPLSILSATPINDGESYTFYGYGIIEKKKNDRLDRGRAASLIIDDVFQNDLLLKSTHVNSGASICPGDSGGPLVKKIGKISVVIGIGSLTTNRVEDSKCILNASGEAIFVDLQSPISLSFLSQFTDIKYAAGS